MRPISMNSTHFLTRRAAGWWAAVLLSACVIESPPLAVPDGDTDEPPAATVGRLTGVVEIESAALAPVRPAAPVGLEGATVEALVNGSVVASTTTAADGSWTLDELTPGTYAVRAWYETTAGVFAVVQDDVAVVAGNVVDLGRLQLELTGAIQGTVELADRGDWSNAQVFIPGSSFVAITGSNGKFTLLYVPEGVWTVRATAAGYSAVTVSDVTVKAGEVTILSDSIVLIPTDAEVAIPETTILTKPAALVDSGSATFSFAADLPSSFQCRLDGSAWAVCASPTTYSDLAEGSHTFEVRASTGPGAIDATPAVWTWTIDLTPPETTILSAPSGYVAAATATVTFGGSDSYGVASFECRMDGGSWAACTSPHALSALSTGTRLFEVRAIDAAGHSDPTPATASWIVDLARPQTYLAAPPSYVAVTTVTITFSGTDNYGVAAFECGLNSGAWAACKSPHEFIGLAAATHTLGVRAVDHAGLADLTPATATLTVDLVAPNTTIDSGPTGGVSGSSTAFTFSGTDNHGVASFECRLDGGAWAACTSPRTLSNLAAGTGTFEVRAVDLAGVADPTPATATWTVDRTSPQTSISSAPSGYVAATTTTITFSGSDNYGVASYECRLDGSTWAACTSPQALSGLAAGAHSFAVRAIDQAGLADPTPASATWTVDPVAPDTEIRRGPTGGVSGSSPLFEFSGSDNYGVALFECRLDGGTWVTCASPHLVTNLAEGARTFEVRAVDVANAADPTPSAIAWTVDASTTDTIIHSGPAGSEQTSAAVFIFGCDSNKCVYWCRLDGGAWERCISPKTYTALAVGDHTFEVRAVDDTATADPTPAQWTWTTLGVDVEWVDLSASTSHTCGIRTDGTTWCWGRNDYGQLGDGTSGSGTNKSTPVQVGTLTDWHSISAGGAHTCGVRIDGTAWCWGLNNAGQFGDGTTTSKPIPTQVGTATDWHSISAGGYHTCGVRIDGTAWCWGYAESGQLGDGTSGSSANKSIPTRIGASTDWQSISAGSTHTCGVQTDGTAWCWGLNTYGQLGDGSTTSKPIPTQIGTSTDWQSISAGSTHTCGVQTDGTAWCWGLNTDGQLGDGTIASNKKIPTQVGTATNWQSITADSTHTCGVQTDGTAWCWGLNTYGQLGDGTSGSGANKSTPTQVGTLTDWLSISVGSLYTCGVRTDGTIWCWGRNDYGQLGNGTTGRNAASPTRVGDSTNWQSISVGGSYTCGVRTDGTAWCWGLNTYGQLGDGSTINKPIPTQIGASTDWQSISAGGSHTCGVRTDGTAWCWGASSHGKLGDGSNGNFSNKSTPVQVGVSADWQSITAGSSHTCGVRTDGTAWCWGYLAETNLFPTQVGTETDWQSISAGGYHTCGVRIDGTAWCWGNNTYGQLGDGSTADNSTPMQVGTLNGWQSITAGSTHTCGVRTDGTAWCWGRNTYGQLGDGTTANNSTPTQVGTATNWQSISAATSHTCGVRTDGTTWCWGFEGLGHNNPAPIGVSTDWQSIAAGSNHICGVQADGTAWCWGANHYGQLGNGAWSAIPVAVVEP